MITNTPKTLLRSLLRFGLFLLCFAGLLVLDVWSALRARVMRARDLVADDAAEARLQVRAIGRLRGGRGGSAREGGGLRGSMGLPDADLGQNASSPYDPLNDRSQPIREIRSFSEVGRG